MFYHKAVVHTAFFVHDILTLIIFLLSLKEKFVMNSDVLCLIYNYKHNENAVLWKNRLSQFYETYILDSGSGDMMGNNIINLDNIYYGGLFTKSIEFLKNKEYKWLFVICSDVLIDEENFNKLIKSLNVVTDSNFVGEYQPSTLSDSHNVWLNNINRNTGKIRVTDNIEGWMFLVKSDVVFKLSELGIDFSTDMKFGWGIDLLLSYYSYKLGYCNVVDDNVIVKHPNGKSGYDGYIANIEMNSLFSKIGTSYNKLINNTIAMRKKMFPEKEIKFITYNTFVNDIRSEFKKVPKDIIGIIGVPRSGMIPATIISEYLNVGLVTVDEFVKGKHRKSSLDKIFNKHGNRKLRKVCGNKVLVVDDTCYNGNEISKLKEIFKEDCFKNIEFIYLVGYLEGDCHLSKPDVYLKDIREEAKNSSIGVVLYEWNIFSNPAIINSTLFDLDGVFCVDPPDERNHDEYIKYIKNPIPLHIPTTNDKITICTYRLNKYRKETNDFILSLGVEDFKLFMFKADTYEERSKIEPWFFKGSFYKSRPEYKLFIESDDSQARKINEISGKPVYCVETNKVYN